MSLAYSHISGAPLAPIRDTLARHAATLPAVLTRVSLININRDNGMYQWQLIQRTLLAAAPTTQPDS